MYAFGGLITRLYHAAGVLKENLDYVAPLFPSLVDITRTKGLDTKFGPTFTTVELHRKMSLSWPGCMDWRCFTTKMAIGCPLHAIG